MKYNGIDWEMIRLQEGFAIGLRDTSKAIAHRLAKRLFHNII